MKLNLWLVECKRDIEDYYFRRGDARYIGSQMAIGDDLELAPLFLNVAGEFKQDFTLDEIDSFTSGFKNLEAVRERFKELPGYEEVGERAGRLYIANKSCTDKYQVVYDSPLLEQCALLMIEKRKKGLPKFLDRTSEMRAYVQKLANYAIDSDSGPLIRNFNLLPSHVQRVLRDYNESINFGDISRSDACFEELFGFCMNYKTLRAFIIWEQDYLSRIGVKSGPKIDSVEEFSDDEERLHRLSQYEDELRLLPISPELERINSMRDSDGNIDYDQVYSQFDLDDIHSYGKRALQSIGILPIEDPPKGKVLEKK